jgi:hypothetical protein
MSILGKKLVKSWDTFLGNIVIIKPLANRISQWIQVSEDDYYQLDEKRINSDNYFLDIWGNKFIMEFFITSEGEEIFSSYGSENHLVHVSDETKKIFLDKIYPQNIIPYRFRLYRFDVAYVRCWSEKNLPKKFNASIHNNKYGYYITYEGE